MKVKTKNTIKRVEANERVFTFCILRVGTSSQNSTHFSIGATVRSSTDADNLKRDRNGNVVKDREGNAIMIDPNLPNIIAEGRALKRPIFTFDIAYNINESGRFGFPIVDAMIETIVSNPENFFAGYRSEVIKRMKMVQNEELENITIVNSNARTTRKNSEAIAAQ
jgi:hypothetical protein